MKIRQTIGTGVRTMVKVTTDGHQHQGMVNVTRERAARRRVCEDEGVRDSVVTTCAVTVYSPV